MANLPKKFNRGEMLAAKDINLISNAIRENHIVGDGKTIKVTRSSGGTTISYIGGDNENIDNSESYEGYFLATNTSSGATQKVTIAEGQTIINNQLFNISEEEFTITDTSYIYLYTTYESPITDDEGTVTTAGFVDTPILYKTTSKLTYEAGTFFNLIVEIEYSNSIITNIIQQAHGQINGFILAGLLDALDEDLAALADADAEGSGDGSGYNSSSNQRRLDDMAADTRYAAITSCTGGRNCVTGGRLKLTGSSYAEVQALVDGLDADTECGNISGMTGTSCGDPWIVQPTTSYNGTDWFAEVYIGCCGAVSADEESVGSDCLNGENCYDTQIEYEYADWNSAFQAKTELLSSLDAVCIGQNFDNGACGSKELEAGEAYKIESLGTTGWKLTIYACCETSPGEDPPVSVQDWKCTITITDGSFAGTYIKYLSDEQYSNNFEWSAGGAHVSQSLVSNQFTVYFNYSSWPDATTWAWYELSMHPDGGLGELDNNGGYDGNTVSVTWEEL
jgi:hypothetical protein